MKRIRWQAIIGLVTMVWYLSSCQQEMNLYPSQDPTVPEGFVSIRFAVNLSDMQEVETRSVDPDGQDINNMSLFCFNAYGLFLSAIQDVTLENKTEDEAGHETKGNYTAEIPEETAIIHFFANQNSALYEESDFVNKTEAQVLADMEGASGMMIYWARFAKALNGKDIQAQLSEWNEGKGVVLIRNQAKVTIDNWNPTWTGGSFQVAGYVVTNIHAFGTVAPFCQEHGFAIYQWPPADGHYSVTLPENRAMMSDITDINTKSEDYIFEHENTLDNPVSVIIKGKHNGQSEDLYYRAMIMNHENGDMIPILRNHHYKLNISGKLSYGKPTFEEALNGPATNNVWVSVGSWVREVADNQYKLTLKETNKVFHEEDQKTSYSFEYTLTKADGTLDVSMTAPEITWMDGNNVARHEFIHSYDSSTGKGTITITLLENNPEIPEQMGTLLVRKGRLYRTIELSMISTQKFVPSWVGTQVYGGTTGNFVTLKFTIPESCPKSLYPFDVYLSVNSLDVRSSSGMALPVVVNGEDNYWGDDNSYGYKYMYTVEKPGVHRVYFHNILDHKEGVQDSIWIEADFFEKLTKTFTYATHRRSITVEGLLEYENVMGDGYAQDEPIMYLLVPQKINAPVVFSMRMKDLSTNPVGNINAEANDEFMLYSKTLDYALTADLGMYGITGYDCIFYDVDESYWKTSTNGRVMMFMPNTPAKTGAEVGHYKLYMKTNCPRSQDVIRISSNQKGSHSAHPDKTGQDYAGYSYRSTIFELANNYPFRLAAQIKVGTEEVGTWTSGDTEEVTETVELSYEPNQELDISFDITSFKDRNGNSVHPFGTAFDVYIDAPMLEVDYDRLATLYPDWSEDKRNQFKEKFRKDPLVPGRFIYTVDANRETERNFGTDEVKIADGTGANQGGERKVLPFKTNTITSAGDITISSDVSKVVYFAKKFKLKNLLIEGNIQFKDASDQIHQVPKDAFVAFVRTRTNTRIGSITVYEDGKFRLNLRKEYAFNWTADPIEFDYKDKVTGIVYDWQVNSLQDLFADPNIILTPSVL